MNGDQLLESSLAELIRVGTVTGRIETSHRLRVEFADTTTAPVTTAELQCIVRRAKEDKEYDLPDIGDQVLCIFLPNGKETGFVIGSMYGAESPPVSSGDKWHRTFKDGTVLEYDRAAHKLLADVKGSAEVKTTGEATYSSQVKVTVAAPNIIMNGNVTAAGPGGGEATVTETANRTINGSLTVNGPVNINGDASISGNNTVGGNSRTSGDSYAASRSGASI